MRFKVGGLPWNPSAGNAYLEFNSSWNDWYRFKTLYVLTYIDENGQRIEIGGVKIGQFGMEHQTPDIPDSFEDLGDDFFSLGQDVSYYEALKQLRRNLSKKWLFANYIK